MPARESSSSPQRHPQSAQQSLGLPHLWTPAHPTLAGSIPFSRTAGLLSNTTRSTSYVTRSTPHVTRSTPHVSRSTSLVTRSTSHVTRSTPHVSRSTPHHATSFCGIKINICRAGPTYKRTNRLLRASPPLGGPPEHMKLHLFCDIFTTDINFLTYGHTHYFICGLSQHF